MYCIEDADALPLALTTTLGDGMPLKAAEQWSAASRTLVEWVGSDADKFGDLNEPGEV